MCFDDRKYFLGHWYLMFRCSGTKVFRYSTYVFNLSDMQATVIDPADMEGLEAALNNNNVSSEEICQFFFSFSI